MIGLRAAIIAAVMAAALPAVAQDGSGDLADGSAATTLTELEELAETHPRDATVAFNLGLRYAQGEELGTAILYLERAHLLRPLDREASDALHVVRREARRVRAEALPNQTIVEGEPTQLFWWRFFSALPEQTYAIALLAGMWLLFGLLLIRRRIERGLGRDAALVGAVLAGLLILNATGMWVGKRIAAQTLRPAVVIAEEPRYSDAPDELADTHRQPNLYEGAVALIREEREGWMLVELVDGERIWVRPDVAQPVLPRP